MSRKKKENALGQLAKLVTVRWGFVRKVAARVKEFKDQVDISLVISSQWPVSLGETLSNQCKYTPERT